MLEFVQTDKKQLQTLGISHSASDSAFEPCYLQVSISRTVAAATSASAEQQQQYSESCDMDTKDDRAAGRQTAQCSSSSMFEPAEQAWRLNRVHVRHKTWRLPAMMVSSRGFSAAAPQSSTSSSVPRPSASRKLCRAAGLCRMPLHKASSTATSYRVAVSLPISFNFSSSRHSVGVPCKQHQHALCASGASVCLRV